MNATDRRRLNFLLWDLVRSVPGPASGGSQSASFYGIVGHSRDASHAMALMGRYLSAMLAPTDTEDTPEAVEVEAREWIERRESEGWCGS